MDDTDLLREYVERRSERSFTQLVERHIDLVFSAALRQVGGDVHQAQDVTQMVFTALAHKAARLVRHPSLIGWLYQSTRWAAAGVRRAEQRRERHERMAADEWPRVWAEAVHEDWAHLRPVIDDVLNALSARDRESILLRFFADRKYAEVGACLGLDENAARMRTERALDRLRVLLVRRGITSTGAALAAVLRAHALSPAPVGLAGAVSGAALAGLAGGGAIDFLQCLLMSKSQIVGVAFVALALAVWLGIDWRNENRMRRASEAWSPQNANMAAGFPTVTPSTAETGIEAVPDGKSENEEQVRAVRAYLKGALDQVYAPLFRRLKLDRAALDRLKDLLVEGQLVSEEPMQRAYADGIRRIAELRAVFESATQESKGRIHDLLGASQAGYFDFFQETILHRGQLLPFVRQLDSNGCPLTDDQCDEFVRLNAVADATLFLSVPMDAQAVDAVRALLLPEQFEEFKRWNVAWARRERIAELNREGEKVVRGDYAPELLAHPEYLALVRAEMRERVRPAFEMLLRDPTLSVETLTVVEDKLIEIEMVQIEGPGVAATFGVDAEAKPGDAFLPGYIVADEIKSELGKLLGKDAYERYLFALSIQPRTSLIVPLVDRLSYSTSPLEKWQAEQLALMYTNEQKTNGVDQFRNVDEARERFLESTAAVLRSEQVEALRQILAEQAAERQYRKRRGNTSRKSADWAR